jgi:hypothetical protein
MKEVPDDFSTVLRRKLALPQIPALNGIRAIAVFLVIFYHYGLRLPGGFKVPGAHGVLIFFVMSGFLITWLLLKENEKYGRISLSGFYRRRVLRIFPAVLFLGAARTILLVGHHEIVWLQTISSFFLAITTRPSGDPNVASVTPGSRDRRTVLSLLAIPVPRFRHDLKKMTVFLVGLIGSVWIY